MLITGHQMTTDERLYLNLLIDHIEYMFVDSGDIPRSYDKLCECMFSIACTEQDLIMIGNDINRIDDAIGLRESIIDSASDDGEIISEDNLPPISFLEVFTALVDHVSDSFDFDFGDVFVVLLENLGVDAYTDNEWDSEAELAIRFAVKRVMKRGYQSNGVGGLFPIIDDSYVNDQKRMELWYQANDYYPYFLNEFRRGFGA